MTGSKKRWVLVLAVLTATVLASCDAADPAVPGGEEDLGFLTDVQVVTNPSGVAPLTARITVTTSRPVSVEVTVAGRDGSAISTAPACMSSGTSRMDGGFAV